LQHAPLNPAVLCRLYLNAVMPCLDALASNDAAARDILGDTRAKLVFRVQGGPAITIGIADGAVTVTRGAAAGAAVILHFFSDRHLNASFAGKRWALPLLAWGGWRIGLLTRFTRLTDRLKAVMDGSAEVLATAEGRALHARLSLIAAGLGLGPLARGDSSAQAALSLAPPGLAVFAIRGAHHATVWFDHGSRDCNAGWGPPPREPDVEISFIDSAVAFAALRGEIDTIAAIGAGQIRVSGLIPLADGVNMAMERLSDYLQT
jgi:hypothetical protein